MYLLCVSFNTNSCDDHSVAVEAMERCIVDIRQWMLSDKLQLNDGMTEFVVIGTRKQLVKFSIDGSRVGDCVVFPSSVVEDLGCWLDGQIKINEHINKVCKASFFHLCNIQRIRKFLRLLQQSPVWIA